MESNPRFEIVNETGPVIKVVGDTGEVTEVKSEETPVVNPRYKYLGQYNVSDHPNYKPSPMFRDMKWLLAYDKQAAKYPKRFKQRANAALA
jgi:hypothetical protein